MLWRNFCIVRLPYNENYTVHLYDQHLQAEYLAFGKTEGEGQQMRIGISMQTHATQFNTVSLSLSLSLRRMRMALVASAIGLRRLCRPRVGNQKIVQLSQAIVCAYDRGE